MRKYLKSFIFLIVVVFLLGFLNFPVNATINNDLVRIIDSPKIYLIYNNTALHIPSPTLFNQAGFKWANIRTVSASQFSAWPMATMDFAQYLSGQSQAKAVEIKSVNAIKDKTQAGIYLTTDEKKLLPDINWLTSQYPALEIHDINSGGDFVGKLAKSEYDPGEAFGYIGSKLIKLGKMGGVGSTAIGLNDKGQIVGYFEFDEIGVSGGRQAFLYENNQVTKLPFLNTSFKKSIAQDIDNNGLIVGMSGYKTATAGSEQVRAVYWLNGQARDMGMIDDVLSADCYTVWAMDINARDQIIGRGGSVQNDDFVYQNGKMYSLKQILKTYQAIKDFVGQDNFVLPDSLKFNLDGSFDIEIKKYVSTQTTAESQTSISVTSQVKTFNIFLPADLKTLNLPNTSTSQSNN